MLALKEQSEVPFLFPVNKTSSVEGSFLIHTHSFGSFTLHGLRAESLIPEML